MVSVQEAVTIPVPQAPSGFVAVYNRLMTPYEGMFDGRVYRFAPQEVQLLPIPVGEHLSTTSVFSYDPAYDTSKAALVLGDDAMWGVPYTDPPPAEWIDRSTDPEPYVKRGTDGEPLHTEIRPIVGAQTDISFEKRVKSGFQGRTKTSDQ